MPTKIFGAKAVKKTAAPAAEVAAAAKPAPNRIARGSLEASPVSRDPWLSDDARRDAVNAGVGQAKPRWFAKRAHRWLRGTRG